MAMGTKASKWAVCVVGWALSLGAVGPAPAQPTRDAREEFVVQVQGQPGGTMSVLRDGAGTTRVEFSWRDNGRGPDMSEEFRVDAAGVPQSYRVRGKATYGAVIDEEASLEGGRLRWRSPADQGDEAAAGGGSVHVPLESTPAYWGQILQALISAPDGRRATIGGAMLQAERLAKLSVRGDGGATVDLALYSLVGIDVEPWYLWLRDDPGHAFFAVAWPGWQVTPAGYEGVGPQLIERMKAAQFERLRRLRERLVQPLPGVTLIRAVRWFDAPAARLRGPSDVYLFGGRIGAVTEPGALAVVADQAVDGTGRTLLPGLWDMHAHMWPGAALMHLAGGVVNVRDLANQNEDLRQLKERIDSGVMIGPGIVPAGFIEGKSPFSSRNGVVAATLEEALRAVDGYAARGVAQIKLYNSIKPEWVRPLAERAHRHGMTVAGHVPAFMRAEQAVRAGYDELTHINQLMLNFFVKPEHDTRTLLRFTLVGDEARKVVADSAEARRFIALLRQRGTAVDPTLATFEAMFTQRDGELNPTFGAIADHLPVLWRRGLKSSEMSPDAKQIERYRASYARMVQFVGAMHRAGVPLVAGTDGTPGLLLHRELELYVQAGIPAAEALRIGTWNGARRAGESLRTGSIERGKAAELILVEGDPTKNIADIRRTALVVKGTEAYAPAQLYEELGLRPFAPAAAIVRAQAAPAPSR